MKKIWLTILCMVVLATACTSSTANSNTPILPTPAADKTTHLADSVTLTIVYTSDEHGWMAGEETGSGAAELAGLWSTEFSESDLVLPISGGDNWTGPAISTWFEGESMVETMNAMGYTAAAVGNHEFDFDLPGLTARAEQADFPYLAANIRDKDGQIPTDLGIQPYTIIDAVGLQIGIIGLAYQDTPSVTNPIYISDLEFNDYESALREYVPQVREAGADLIIVPAHICEWDLSHITKDIEDMDIALFGAGHCHELFADQENGAVLLGGGSNLRGYAYATFEIATDTMDRELIDFGTELNAGGNAHTQVAEIVAHWQDLTDEELDVSIGYLQDDIEQRSDEMAALTTEAWLWAYPADVAITNWGGMRDRLPAGQVTYASIISMMPFDNVLMDVSLTGAELEKVLASGDSIPAVGGIFLRGGQWIFKESGKTIDPEATYKLLTTDFMYAGGDDYRIAEFDPQAYNTAINWRQPVIDWILAQQSSPEKPLDPAIRAFLE
jgi:2',3'-cyclic-nucleotide 2'-phosphodiesterase (5'-nucleotidase family)